MRTTVNLASDLAARIKDLADVRGQSFEQVLDDLIRQGLARLSPPPYQLEPHRGGFRPGVDPWKPNQLVDELDVEDFVANAGR